MKKTYIRNNPINGVDIDYKKISKEFKNMMRKCKAPEGLFDPCHIPYDSCKWSVLMSERSSSKTTQLLLYWLIVFKEYGLKICYVRQNKEQITHSMYSLLFKVVTMPEYGYIEYLSGGKYNNIFVDRNTKHCYFCRYDENGKMIEKSPEHFLVLMSVDQFKRYCSTFNVPDHDSIIFDEFSWGHYTPEEFEHFCQIIATVRRERESTRITLLSNTITPYNQYLRELGISGQLAKMKKGDHAIITSELGARVYTELLNVGIHNTVEFNQKSLSYFGFENESLRAIYGGEWEIKGYKHLPPSKTRKINRTNIILQYMGNNIRVSSFHDGKMAGLFLSPYTREIKPEHTIITDTPTYSTDNMEIVSDKLISKLARVDSLGLLYFADNETGLQWSALRQSITTKKII